MSEFARSLFNFGAFQRPCSQSPEPSMQANHTKHSRAEEGSKNSSMSSSHSQLNQFPSKIFPQTSTPTTAVSSSSLAYGTTTSNQAPDDLLRTVSNDKVRKVKENHPPSNPVTVAQTNPDTAIPRGKLRITIIEAQNLNIPAHTRSFPYVVCSFESSEFVTQGPESYDNTPGLARKSSSAVHMKGSRPMLQSHSSQRNVKHTTPGDVNLANPLWHHQCTFDVIGATSELDISIYDSEKDDMFLGHVRIRPQTTMKKSSFEEWVNLESRIVGETVKGRIRVRMQYFDTSKRHYGPEDFEILRLLGKGTFGQVFQVRKRDTGGIYAMKVLSKKVIVRKKEIAHTIGERDILVTTASSSSPFIVGLKFSFQTPSDLYLVTDYMSGGELFWHLQKEGRFAEDRAKFYIAQLVLALEHLHENDIIYRDLKPENILLDANGNIALCDFGLSKANLTSNGTTNTFCGTTEYLAPEVLLDESGYTKMVDFWSLGVLIFEMCCGWSPFYAENTQQMYKNIAFGKVRFPKEVLSPEGRSFVKGLLNRNPKHRMGATYDAKELREHPFFDDIDWKALIDKKIPPPFKPHLANETDTSNFDPEFTSTSTSVINRSMHLGSTPLSPAIQANFNGFTYVDESTMFDHFGNGALGTSVRNKFRGPGSLIPGNPNLPPEEEVIEEEGEEYEDKMDVDELEIEDEFVNGQFDL